jgi:acyl-coenzyme A thioesterase PaaI-like protein
MLLVDIKIGNKLNGNHGIIHGGIISLLFDEAMGWARGIMTHPNDPTVIYVTANLNVNFRAPFIEGSEAVIRVYHESTVNSKVRFSAVLEAYDGSLVFAEAGGLFLPTKSKL